MPSITTPSVAMVSPGTHDKSIVELQLTDRYPHLDAVAQYRRVARGEIEQRVEGLARRTLGARFEVTPEQDKDRHGRGDLE